MDVRGPSGLLVYNGRREFAIRKDKKSEPKVSSYKKISMIAGGMIHTPMPVTYAQNTLLLMAFTWLLDSGLDDFLCF